MDKKTLIVQAARKSGLTKKQTRMALNAILETIKEALVAGDSVILADFGRFEVQPYLPRRLRRFDGNGHFQAEHRQVPVFKPSDTLRRCLRNKDATRE